MMNYEVRKAAKSDFEEIKRVYGYAREFMKENGNPSQWNNTYPPDELIIKDIQSEISYVITESEKIGGVFVFFPDKDPIYDYIEGGQWLNTLPYGTIHRVASDSSIKGIVSIALEEAKKMIKNIKIDTHEDNKVMQHVLEKNGFVRCGIIYLENGEKRIGYQYSE